MESSPHLKLTIDMRADDKDIYYELFQQIKAWREARKVKRFNIRDPIKKFLYTAKHGTSEKGLDV
jgi:hypothetical protein